MQNQQMDQSQKHETDHVDSFKSDKVLISFENKPSFVCQERWSNRAMQIWKVGMSDPSCQQQTFHDYPKHLPLLLVVTDDDVHFTSHQKQTPCRC